MLAIVGTVPDIDVPLLDGAVTMSGGNLLVDGRTIAPDRGTPALLGAAVRTALHLGQPMPHVFLIGDQGRGDGSRELYAHLEKVLPERSYSTIVFHYLQPDVDWHNKVLFAIESMADRPQADRGCRIHVRGQDEWAGFGL